MKTTVITHSADFDGLFCQAIARKFLGTADVDYIGWDFKDAPLPIPDGQIYILDLPVDRVFGYTFVKGAEWPTGGIKERIVWIDHHASSLASHPSDIPGYRLDGVAACRLAYQWFTAGITRPPQALNLTTKEPYINREVLEPLAVRLAGEYDIWDKRDPRAELFQHGLRSRDLGENMWELLLSPQTGEGEGGDGKQSIGDIAVQALLDAGEVLQYVKTQENADIITSYGFDVEFEGLWFLACNHARFNSHLFTAGIKESHDALFGFKWTGKDWSVSLYHAPGKEHHDLSLIAVKHGGGGHRGACGFRTTKLAFLQ